MLQKFFSLSTGHIAPSDAKLLDARVGSLYALRDDGYLITTAKFPDGSGILDRIIADGASPSFKRVVELARQNGADYLWLSPDGPVNEDLEFHEW